MREWLLGTEGVGEGHAPTLQATRVHAVHYPVGEVPRLVRVVDRTASHYDLLGCQCIHFEYSQPTRREGITLDVVCDDEGKIDGAKPNRAVYLTKTGLLWHPLNPYEARKPDDIIFGDFCIVAADNSTGEVVDRLRRRGARLQPRIVPLQAWGNGRAMSVTFGGSAHYALPASGGVYLSMDGIAGEAGTPLAFERGGRDNSPWTLW